MLRYIYGHDLLNYPLLNDSMFRDRAEQFHTRLGWDVRIDGNGHERDEYDALDPLYVIWEMADGRHGGSMRFLPTIGPTMVHDHFAHLSGGVHIESPLIWECTRFCLSPSADQRVTAALVLGAGEVMANFHLSHFVGVFDRRMERIYRRFGVDPDVIGRGGSGRDQIGIGLWEMRPEAWAPVLARVGVDAQTSRAWFNRSLVETRGDAVAAAANLPSRALATA